jgi:hypothetical protein
MINYEERIQELKEELADGRIHQYLEVDHVIKTVIMLTRQEVKREIKELIK